MDTAPQTLGEITVKKIMFVFGILFGLALLVPIVMFSIDTFWFLVTGGAVFQPVSPERTILAMMWGFLAFVVFAWAQRK